ncbi:hypothetical protein PABG_11835 [Paracoccidioides brasiliensis Pb03]|nr:hypothetical protein PABG_11835 [Paracoccidioides brasiliensis Pb03]
MGWGQDPSSLNRPSIHRILHKQGYPELQDLDQDWQASAVSGLLRSLSPHSVKDLGGTILAELKTT